MGTALVELPSDMSESAPNLDEIPAWRREASQGDHLLGSEVISTGQPSAVRDLLRISYLCGLDRSLMACCVGVIAAALQAKAVTNSLFDLL